MLPSQKSSMKCTHPSAPLAHHPSLVGGHRTKSRPTSGKQDPPVSVPKKDKHRNSPRENPECVRNSINSQSCEVSLYDTSNSPAGISADVRRNLPEKFGEVSTSSPSCYSKKKTPSPKAGKMSSGYPHDGHSRRRSKEPPRTPHHPPGLSTGGITAASASSPACRE